MKPRLGISACLLGQSVRYDGGHKRDDALVETLGPRVEWVPVCPEVECGLTVPREIMHLVGTSAAPRIVTVSSNLDHTEKLLSWANARAAELRQERLCGFIFKARSPSCGLAVAVCRSGQQTRRESTADPEPTAVGLWARVFTAAFPQLPVADELRLQDVLRRNHFLEQALAFAAANGHNARAASARRAAPK
jgi:uncharacterized protein YbbK (DUF523 family)